MPHSLCLRDQRVADVLVRAARRLRESHAHRELYALLGIRSGDEDGAVQRASRGAPMAQQFMGVAMGVDKRIFGGRYLDTAQLQSRFCLQVKSSHF